MGSSRTKRTTGTEGVSPSTAFSTALVVAKKTKTIAVKKTTEKAVATDTTPRGQKVRDTVVSATFNSDASGTHTDDDEKADDAEDDGASDAIDVLEILNRPVAVSTMSREAMSKARLIMVHTESRVKDNLSSEDSKDKPPSGDANEPQAGGEHSLSSESAEKQTRQLSGNNHIEFAGLARPADFSSSTHAHSSVHCDEEDEGGQAQKQVRDREPETKKTATASTPVQHTQKSKNTAALHPHGTNGPDSQGGTAKVRQAQGSEHREVTSLNAGTVARGPDARSQAHKGPSGGLMRQDANSMTSPKEARLAEEERAFQKEVQRVMDVLDTQGPGAFFQDGGRRVEAGSYRRTEEDKTFFQDGGRRVEAGSCRRTEEDKKAAQEYVDVEVDYDEDGLYDNAEVEDAGVQDEDEEASEDESSDSDHSDHSYDSHRQYRIPKVNSTNFAMFEREPLSLFAVGFTPLISSTPEKGSTPALCQHLYMGISKTKGKQSREKGLTQAQKDDYERLILNRATGDERGVPENDAKQEEDFAMTKAYLLKSIRDLVNEPGSGWSVKAFATEVHKARQFLEDLWRQREDDMRRSADLHRVHELTEWNSKQKASDCLIDFDSDEAGEPS